MCHALKSRIKLDFDLQFFHQFNPPRPLTKRLKFFQFLIKILMCLQIFPANQTLRSQFPILLIFAITVSPRGKLIELKSTKAWLSGIWYPGKQISSGSLTLGSPYQKALILQGVNLPQGVKPPPPPPGYASPGSQQLFPKTFALAWRKKCIILKYCLRFFWFLEVKLRILITFRNLNQNWKTY